MENNLIAIALFYFRAKLETVFIAGERIRDIVKDENISESDKLSQIITIIEECGFEETATYKSNEEERKMEKRPFSRELFGDFNNGNMEFKITFSTEILEHDCINGVILFEMTLN